MKRVIILGCPGSGKTHFSIQLARLTHLPLTHLDKYWHDVSRWSDDIKHKREKWNDFTQKLINKPVWIIDGNYESSLDMRIQAADTIIFFDYSRRVVFWRLFRRWHMYQNRKAHRRDMPDDWRETLSWSFLKYVWNFPGKESASTKKAIQEVEKAKCVVIFSSPAQAERFLREVSPNTTARQTLQT